MFEVVWVCWFSVCGYRFVVLGGFGLNSGVCIVACGCLCVWGGLVRLGLLV